MKHVFALLILTCCSAWLTAQEEIEIPIYATFSDTYDESIYGEIGAVYNLITLRDDLISPGVYSGSGFSIPANISYENDKWHYGIMGEIGAGWLSSSLHDNPPAFSDGLNYKLIHFRVNGVLYGERRIKQSPHCLGGSFGVLRTKSRFLKPDKTASLAPFIQNIKVRDLVFTSNMSYTYMRNVFERPLHINVQFPVMNMQRSFKRRPWNFGSVNNYLHPSINIKYSLNKPEWPLLNYRLFYNWDITHSNRNNGDGYQQLAAVHALGVVITFY